jgi:hypothetical protein
MKGNKMKNEKQFMGFLAKNLEEKILLEKCLLDRLNVLISQNGTISGIYREIKIDLDSFRKLREGLEAMVKDYKKFKSSLKKAAFIEVAQDFKPKISIQKTRKK